jgi:hypothetical protein
MNGFIEHWQYKLHIKNWKVIAWERKNINILQNLLLY